MVEFLIKQICRVLSVIIKIFLVRSAKEILRSHRGIKAIEILQTPLSLFILSEIFLYMYKCVIQTYLAYTVYCIHINLGLFINIFKYLFFKGLVTCSYCC